jgi:hypothetical protein
MRGDVCHARGVPPAIVGGTKRALLSLPEGVVMKEVKGKP